MITTKHEEQRKMSTAEPGQPLPIDQCRIPVMRILGRNPGPMTGTGTNSYLIGSKRLCLLDPGPRDDAQFESFMTAIGDRKLAYILVTHTHGDHSPGALRLHEATGAELVGLPAPQVNGHDKSFQPVRHWRDGDRLDCGEYRIELVHTPGHVSNHMCFLLKEEQLLFTGDHVLQGTTSVILPPDGDMGAYLESLHSLRIRPLKALAPGHGDIMYSPQAEIDKLIAHRCKREQKIVTCLQQLGEVDLDILLLSVYDDVAPHLLPWAEKTLLAHLLKLEREERAERTQERWILRAASGQ